MGPEEFSRERRTLIDQLIGMLLDLFGGLGSWRQEDVAAFQEQAIPAVQASQQTLAAMCALYVASQASEQLGYEVTPPGIPDDAAVDLREDVTPQEVYRRPFVTVYTYLSEGAPLDEAVKHGQTRLAEIVEADLQQTYARAMQAAMEAVDVEPAERARFWRRTLVGETNCALCVIASTQRYRVEDLNPIHPGCDCRVDPIFGSDPGQVIEPELLEQVHDAVEALTGESDRGGRATDYRQLMVQMTPEHGELGPMLVRPRDRFTSADDL